MKKISLEKIQKRNLLKSYDDLVNFIVIQINEGKLKPLKSKGNNGKRPTLFNYYWIIEENVEVSEYIEELKYTINPKLDISYYINHIEKYLLDRKNILLLSYYLDNNIKLLDLKESLNERSFEIFKREKYLKEEGGVRLLKNLSYDIENLNIYYTTEPLAIYSRNKNINQNILIIENKDTFYSMRDYLIKGNSVILNLEVSTLIYGAGKKINRSFNDFIYAVEPAFRQ
jgi:hypothetical protein